MSNLTITIQESITLPNGNKEVLQNTKVISGVNQTLRRVDTISSTVSGSGLEILRFTDSEAQQTAGSFVKSDVKYVRITNLDSAISVNIALVNEDVNDGEFAVFKLEAGKSLMFSNGEFNASQTGDYALPGVFDVDYFADYGYVDVIRAKASSGSAQLEYFVASA